MKEAIEQLRLTLDRLSERQQRVKVFFRDDDVDEDEARLRMLLDLFEESATPVNLEIIPGRLTEPGIQLLRQRRRAQPALFELNQHGWQHVNHELQGRKCEFGLSRSFDEQLSDILRGKQVLEQAFGEAFSPVFTPPWNRCTDATHRALDQLGFQALSKLNNEPPVTGHGFREISVTLDLFRWKGGAAMKTPAEFVAELNSQLSALNIVGVMLHHKVMDAAAFELAQSVVSELRRSDAVQIHSFQSLLRATK
jgi:peptidoglycan/xylan/chitin deacetylase (PgdA/CDA1 family)